MTSEWDPNPRTLANGRVTNVEVARAVGHVLERARFDAVNLGGPDAASAAAADYFADFPYPDPLELEALKIIGDYILNTAKVEIVGTDGRRVRHEIHGFLFDPSGRVRRLDLGPEKPVTP